MDPRELKSGIRWRACHPRKEIGWIRGTDLSSGEPVFVPHARLYMESAPAHADADILSADSNGLASGNDLWEAICHGLYETIERDCDWRWHRLSFGERRRRLLDNETIDSPPPGPSWTASQRRMSRRGSGTSHRLSASRPIVASSAVRRVAAARRGYGAGCHLSAEVALSRAITEAAQSRLTYIVGSRDDLFPSSYEQRRARCTLDASEPLARRHALLPGTPGDRL